MKKIMHCTLALILVSSVNVSAQSWKNLKSKVKEQTEKLSIPKELPSSGVLSQDEVGRGLKEALNQGVRKGVEQLNKKDGYLKDIPLTLKYTIETAFRYEETKELAKLLTEVSAS